MSLDKISSIFNESGHVAVTDWGTWSVSCLFHIFCGQTFPRHTQVVLLFFSPRHTSGVTIFFSKTHTSAVTIFFSKTHKWCYYFFLQDTQKCCYYFFLQDTHKWCYYFFLQDTHKWCYYFFLQDTHKWCYYFFNTRHARLASLVTPPSLHPLKMYAAKQTRNVEFTGQKKRCRSKILTLHPISSTKVSLVYPTAWRTYQRKSDRLIAQRFKVRFQALKCPSFIPQLGELIRENLRGSLLKGPRSNFKHLSVPCLSHSLENLSEKIWQAHCSKVQGQISST